MPDPYFLMFLVTVILILVWALVDRWAFKRRMQEQRRMEQDLNRRIKDFERRSGRKL